MVVQFQYTFEDYREGLEEVRKLQREISQKKAKAKRWNPAAIIGVLTGVSIVVSQMMWPGATTLALVHGFIDLAIVTAAFGAIALVNAIRGRRRIVPNRNLWRGVITFVIFVAGAALFSPKLWNHGIVNEFILPHAGIAVFALLIIAMSVSSTSARIRKSWEQNMWLQLPKSADISVDGVTQSDSASRSAWQWTGFIRAEESKNLFVFFISPSNFLVIPKRAFESEEQIAAMRAMMRLADGNRTGGFPVNLPPPMADK